MASKAEVEIRALVLQAIKGNQKAYADLLHEISRYAHRFIAGRLAKNCDHDDIVQEVLISVHKALPTYDPERAFMPWLASIMHYRFKDYLRKYYAEKEGAHIEISEVQEFLLQDVTEEADTGEYLEEALLQLEGKQRDVIQAMYQEELSVKEVSEKLKMSVSAVKVTAHRAYQKLRGGKNNAC